MESEVVAVERRIGLEEIAHQAALRALAGMRGGGSHRELGAIGRNEATLRRRKRRERLGDGGERLAVGARQRGQHLREEERRAAGMRGSEHLAQQRG